MRALKSKQASMRLIGIGGGEMAAEGLQPLVPPQHFAVIGFSLIAHLPAIYRYIREVADAVVAARPDVLVIIDSPELTHRIARRVRKATPSIPDRQLRLAVGLGMAARPRARHAAPMSITCSPCCRSSRRCMRGSAGRRAAMSGIR